MSCRQIILILGMHRSGTSLVAEILQANGISTGNKLISKNLFNTGGHFEDRFLVWINKKILCHFGGQWDHPPKLPDDWLGDDYVKRLLEDVKDYRLRVIDRHDRFFFKDPRTSILLPFWQTAFGEDIRHVFILRNPRDVVNSLLRRNHAWLRPSKFWWRFVRRIYHLYLGAHEKISSIHAEQAQALWHLYNEQVLKDVIGPDIFVMVYEDLVTNPKREVQGLVDHVAPGTDKVVWGMVRKPSRLLKKTSMDPQVVSFLEKLKDRRTALNIDE